MAATWLRVSTGRVCAQPATSPMTLSFWREDPLLTVETHGSSWIGLGWLAVRSVEAEKMLLEVQSATICIFLADLRWIWAKPTISKQNNTGSLPDLSKTYQILAKNYQIFFWIWEKTHQICVVFEQNPLDCGRIWVKTMRSDQKPQDLHWIWAKISMFSPDRG